MMEQLVAAGAEPRQLVELDMVDQSDSEFAATGSPDAPMAETPPRGFINSESLPTQLGDLPNAPFGERPP